MIKFILNRFKKAEDIKPDPISFHVEKSSDEVLQEALDSVLSDGIKKQMIEMCYSGKAVEDTKNAQANKGMKDDELKEKFPLANYCSSGGPYPYLELGLTFKLDKFIEAIINQAK